MNHLKYAKNRYFYYLGLFSIIISIVSIGTTINKYYADIIMIVFFFLAFLIPLVDSYYNNDFSIPITGKSKLSLSFSDLFSEEYIVITTNRYYDINPTGKYISSDSVLGKFCIEYKKNYNGNVDNLEDELKCHAKTLPDDYGNFQKRWINNHWIYFLVFTDRNPRNQPKDFYIRTMMNFFSQLVEENHGKTVCMPLIGANNNLSDTGFDDTRVAFQNFVAMVNCFGIVNQRSELKLKIIALPEERKNLIDLL